ncbi:OPT/YSL family transporter [Sediminivirga luteola]|uniref:Membrane protein n=1 Tax=Sediminivirga luteola TaxID=1774748 RepID=A0A8J2TV62_9MICO|nr:OPT/YSL family transporter [Sediminivirga luteola]MCI2264687.1 OPT/YSL family transporter [Sediminivirga luteola]GGA02502.1 membrane protein [Sediminivirga luteola]
MSQETTQTSTTTVPQKSFNFTFVVVSAGVAVLGSIIGIQLITSLGITPNTSIIGVLIAIIIARIPIRWFLQFRNIHNQNLIQTTISAATFGAANSLMIPIGIPYVLGMPELVWPMLFGAGFALAVDVFVLYKLFDSKLFGSNEAWPVGVASAEALRAGDQGGKKAKLLGLGILGGAAGAHFGVSMSAFGVAFIGNIWALGFFGVGLLSRAYSDPLFGVDLDALYVPHGMMVGAGVVALGQFVFILIKSRRKAKVEKAAEPSPQASPAEVNPGPSAEVDHQYTRNDRDIRNAFMVGGGLYLSGSLMMALIGGLITDLSIGQLLLFMAFAAAATFATEIIVGIAAMHSGWFPAFAVTLIMLIVGILLGFPPVALALLTGYVAATGPAFADMGYDLKTGRLIREGMSVQQELFGRRQQLKAGIIGFTVAFVVVMLAHDSYFSQDLFAPVNHVYAATIESGISGEVGVLLLLWAIPGALVQLLGGPKRQIGVMFATGLLILNPLAGWAVIAGITLRFIILRLRGEESQNTMYTVAAGFIAGDALYSFFSSLWKARA